MPLGLAASVIAHLVFLGPALILAGGSPFNTPPAEAITVDIVTPEELSRPTDDQVQAETSPGDNASASASPPAARSDVQAAASSPQPAPPSTLPSSPDQRTARQALATPQAPTTPQSVLPAPPFAVPQTAQPEWPQPAAPNDPGGMFGMPMTMPDGAVGGRFDSQAVDRADIANDIVAAFRSHLKTCSKPPAGMAPNVIVVMRIYLKPDGTLADIPDGNPQTIKADGVSRGAGPLSLNARAALRKCQPYKMLPPDRYQEWKMLDITFTPQNF